MAAPWVYSGSVSRSSFQLLGLIDRLGFAPNGPLRLAIQWWPLAPLMLSISVLLLYWNQSRIGSLLGIAAGAYVGAFAGVLRFGATHALRTGFGPMLAMVAGLGMIVTCIWSLLQRRINPQPTLLENVT
jgi:hypothetical protein